MLRFSMITIVLLSAALLACGGPPRPRSTARAAQEEDDRIDDDEDEEEEEEAARQRRDRDGESGSGFVDEALLRDPAGAAVTLGEAAGVPGTGVSLRPPSGSQPMPFGAGFISMRHRIQISVVVAQGPASILDAVRAQSGGTSGEPGEPITIGGQEGRVGRDRVRTPQGELERGWLLVHDGQRGLAVIATYESSRAELAWPAMRESLASVAWDRTVELDPALALGIEVGTVEGFTQSRGTTANVVLLGRGATFPPEPGQPVVTISPLPMQLASDQSARVCEQLVARLLPVPTADIEHEGMIEDGPLPGCERLATADADGQRLATYAALVFTERTPILVTGTVSAGELARWRARFASAARAVRPRS